MADLGDLRAEWDGDKLISLEYNDSVGPRDKWIEITRDDIPRELLIAIAELSGSVRVKYDSDFGENRVVKPFEFREKFYNYLPNDQIPDPPDPQFVDPSDFPAPKKHWFTANEMAEELWQLPPNRYKTREEAKAVVADLGDEFEEIRDPDTGWWLAVSKREELPGSDQFFDSESEATAAILGAGASETHEEVFDGQSNKWVIRKKAEQLGDPEFYRDPDTGQQFMRGAAGEPWRAVPDYGPTSIEDMIIDALTEGGEEGEARAQTLWRFQNQPTDSERLEAALRITTNPSDYFTLMAIARGEVDPIISNPFDSRGRLQRVAPISQILKDAAERFFGAGPFAQAAAGAVPPTGIPAGTVMPTDVDPGGFADAVDGVVDGVVDGAPEFFDPGNFIPPYELPPVVQAARFVPGDVGGEFDEMATGATVFGRGFDDIATGTTVSPRQEPWSSDMEAEMVSRVGAPEITTGSVIGANTTDPGEWATSVPFDPSIEVAPTR